MGAPSRQICYQAAAHQRAAKRCGLITVIASVASPLSGWAQVQRYYVGGGSNWNMTASWSETAGGAAGASVPTNGDTATVTGASSFNIPFDGNYTSPGLAALI